MVIVPSADPEQKIFVLARVALTAPGSVSVTDPVEIQPLVSVTDTLYVPAFSPDRSSEFETKPSGPVHANPNGLLPVAVISIAPELSLLHVRLVPVSVNAGGVFIVTTADPEINPDRNSHQLMIQGYM